MILGALAFFWACAATTYLLTTSAGTGIASSGILAASASGVQQVLPPLATPTGVWVTGLLTGLTLMAGIPAGVALTHPSDQRTTAWTAGLVLLAFSLLAGFSLGLLYLPSTVLLIAAAVIGEVEPVPAAS